jgi:hypothetical protein
MKVINMFGGPGSGKTSGAIGTTWEMIKAGLRVEFFHEYAKIPAYEQNKAQFEDQLLLTAQQNRPLWLIKNKVDFVVSDSPLIQSIQYKPDDYFPEFYNDFIFELWDYYDNVNFFVKRCKQYVTEGRNESLSESERIDVDVMEMLTKRNIPFHTVWGDENIGKVIMGHLIEDGVVS